MFSYLTIAPSPHSAFPLRAAGATGPSSVQGGRGVKCSTSRPGSNTSGTVFTFSVAVGWLDAEDPREALGRGGNIAAIAGGP